MPCVCVYVCLLPPVPITHAPSSVHSALWFACAATVCTVLARSSPKYGLIADRYHFCEKCFNEIQGNSVTLGDDPAQPQT